MAPVWPRSGVAKHFRKTMRRVVAEGLGIAGLLAAVVGSGIMGQQLPGGNVALALLANTLATVHLPRAFTSGPWGRSS